jgi:hypothetical protein
LPLIQPLVGLKSGVFNYLIKLAAFDELHTEVALTFALSYFVNGNNARMIEAGRGFGFQTKTPKVRFGGPLPKANDF